MKDDALTYFKGNVNANLQNYLSKDNSWIYEKYAAYKGDGQSPFGEFKLDVPDFKLDMSAENISLGDYHNTQTLYIALKGLSDTQATDERLWSGLAHSQLWEYMKYRCKIDENTNSLSRKIKNNYFFNQSKRRSLFVNPISRLWWVGRLTFNENSKNHFEALSFFKNNFSTKSITMFSSNFTNNPTITRSIVKSFIYIESQGFSAGENEYREILRYVNLLGGIIILDYLSEEELKEKIINHYCEVHNVSFNFKNEETTSTNEQVNNLRIALNT